MRRTSPRSLDEVVLVLLLALAARALALAARVVPLPALVAWLRARRAPGAHVETVRLVALAELAVRLSRGRCLARALVLAWVLAARGRDATVRLGIARAGDALLSHAWVELEGQPLAEEPSRFVPLASLGSTA